jgi:hypothetical protein
MSNTILYKYLDANGVSQGPVNEPQLKALAAQGIINPQTQMATNTGHRGLAGQIPGLFNATPPPVRPVPVSPTTGISSEAEQQKSRIRFWTTACVVSYIFYASLTIIGAILVIAFPDAYQETVEKANQEITMEMLLAEEEPETMMDNALFYLGILSPLLGIAFLVCYYTYVNRLWRAIPSELAQTTPGKAAFLMLIPLFNFYWQFVAFLGLYKDMNQATEAYGLGSRFGEGKIQVICVGWIVVGMARLNLIVK